MSDRDNAAPSGEPVPADARGAVESSNDPVEPGPSDAGPGGPGERADADSNNARNEDPASGQQSKELAEADRAVIAEVVEEAVREAVTIVAESFSGPLPQAKDLYDYTPGHQERILRMAEAPRTDESARRDRVTDAGIAANKRSAIVQPVLFCACLVLSAMSFWGFKQPIAGSVFLGYPVLNFLAGVRWNWSRRRGERKPPDQT